MRCALVVVLVTSSVAGATAVDCRDAMLGTGARYSQTTATAVSPCERRRIADCHGDLRTVAKIARATARLEGWDELGPATGRADFRWACPE